MGSRLALLVALAACSEAPPRRDAAAPATRVQPPTAQPAASAAPAATLPPAPIVPPPGTDSIATCADSVDVRIFSSPRSPRPDAPLRILAVTARPLDAVLVLLAPDGTEAALVRDRHGATPYSWHAEVAAPAGGTWRAVLGSGPEIAACKDVRVSPERRRPRERRGDVVWQVEWSWERDTENLWSAFVERLFDDPLASAPSWHGLSAVLSDPRRNFLHDHLDLAEDSGGRRALRLEPDCADLPFFLRAYFAWKLGLPFGYSDCTRGSRFGAPRCSEWRSNLDAPPEDAAGDVDVFERFVKRDVGWTIHSGSGRTLPEDDRTDLYPTRLSAETIRPGTVYADPYGHTLIVVRRIPQTDSSGGILLAVDAQPDGTVARKRYWRGNFLFAVDPVLGGAGFKHFRPVVRERGELRPLSNREIERHAEFGDFSLEQSAGGADAFYDRVDDVLSPVPMDPARALRETIQALDEQIRTRVQSVANGEAFVAEHPRVIPMPEGAEIFETTGPWEDYSTPARDLRILIATDVVRDYPARVERRSDRYAMPAGKTAAEVRADLEAILREETSSRRFSYRRSDGSEWTLGLADVLARTQALEVAYDPNDCIEIRWGAPEGTPEASTCRRRAPRDQAARMERYRAWFRERRRPPRE